MRKLTKLPKPQILVDNAVAWTAELLAARAAGSPHKQLESRYRHPQIKDALRAETHAKCAYCESDIEAISYPHVEHILPKDPLPAGTFTWENLTLACNKCNLFKTDRVPDPTNFVHPYDEFPEDRFGFVGPLIKPTHGDPVGRTMVNWLRLNRGELIVLRSAIVDEVLKIFETAILLPAATRRTFVDLAVAPLVDSASRYSRVAQCAADLFEIEFAGQI